MSTGNAIVTMKHPDGTEESTELAPSDYIVLTGPDRYVANVQHYPAKGTAVVTIKTERPEPPDHVRGGEPE